MTEGRCQRVPTKWHLHQVQQSHPPCFGNVILVDSQLAFVDRFEYAYELRAALVDHRNLAERFERNFSDPQLLKHSLPRRVGVRDPRWDIGSHGRAPAQWVTLARAGQLLDQEAPKFVEDEDVRDPEIRFEPKDLRSNNRPDRPVALVD